MNQISLYLDKFKNYGFEEIKLKETIVETIKEVFDYKIERKDISIFNGGIRINVSGPLKSEIFIKKTILMEILEDKLKSLKNAKIRDLK